jgi:hypothetical protein
MQPSAAGSTLMANRPIDRTALRTKSMSTSDAYLFKAGSEQVAHQTGSGLTRRAPPELLLHFLLVPNGT